MENAAAGYFWQFPSYHVQFIMPNTLRSIKVACDDDAEPGRRRRRRRCVVTRHKIISTYRRRRRMLKMVQPTYFESILLQID